jgi:hypothetical protein
LFIGSTLTCLRQVSPGMNNAFELVITAITPNGSAYLPFVIPSEAEGSAVSLSRHQKFTGKRFCSSGGQLRDLQFRGPLEMFFDRSAAKWRACPERSRRGPAVHSISIKSQGKHLALHAG